MKIAITGSNGLIGKELVRQLEERGHRTIALVRNQHQAERPDACWWIPESGVQQLDKLRDIDALIHLAGRSIADRRWTNHEKVLLRKSRVDATRILCDQLSTPRPGSPNVLPTFISASAIGIYGDCGDRVVTEQTPAGSDFLAEMAVEWESAADVLASAGTRVCHARFGVVLDRKAGALAKMIPIFRWGLGGNLGNGRQYWSWILLQDVVQALIWMIEHATAIGPYNVVAPEPVTNAEFTRLLNRQLHRWQFLSVPKFALRTLVGEMADAALLSSCRAVPQRLVQAGFTFVAPTLEQALDLATR